MEHDIPKKWGLTDDSEWRGADVGVEERRVSRHLALVLAAESAVQVHNAHLLRVRLRQLQHVGAYCVHSYYVMSNVV